MPAKIICRIFGKVVLFAEEGGDKRIFSIPVDDCLTPQAIKDQIESLKKKDWVTPNVLKEFEDVTMGFYHLRLRK